MWKAVCRLPFADVGHNSARVRFLFLRFLLKSFLVLREEKNLSLSPERAAAAAVLRSHFPPSSAVLRLFGKCFDFQYFLFLKVFAEPSAEKPEIR